jgi:hypothetical protein
MTRPCTCHPDEAPIPCQEKYALTECIAAAVASRKSEPEYQAHMKWARDVVSNVVIPPADSTDSGDVK